MFEFGCQATYSQIYCSKRTIVHNKNTNNQTGPWEVSLEIACRDGPTTYTQKVTQFAPNATHSNTHLRKQTTQGCLHSRETLDECCGHGVEAPFFEGDFVVARGVMAVEAHTWGNPPESFPSVSPGVLSCDDITRKWITRVVA